MTPPPERQAFWASDVSDDDDIDEMPVAVRRRSARAVRDAEDMAAAAEEPSPRLLRARDMLFAGSALLVLAVAVGAALLP